MYLGVGYYILLMIDMLFVPEVPLQHAYVAEMKLSVPQMYTFILVF